MTDHSMQSLIEKGAPRLPKRHYYRVNVGEPRDDIGTYVRVFVMKKGRIFIDLGDEDVGSHHEFLQVVTLSEIAWIAALAFEDAFGKTDDDGLDQFRGDYR